MSTMPDDADATRVNPVVAEPVRAPQPAPRPTAPAPAPMPAPMPAPKPAPKGPSVAWDDPKTQQIAKQRLQSVLIAAAVGALALIATIVLAVVGVLQHAWGLWVLVGCAGLAGGAIAGAIAGWSIEAPMRRLLKAHPWEKIDGLAGMSGQFVVITDNVRRAYDLQLDTGESLPKPGTPLTLRACGPKDEKVIEFGPKKRWRLCERVAVLLPKPKQAEVDEDDDWQPSAPIGERPGADGLFEG